MSASAELAYMGIAELGARYRMGEISPVEVANAHLARIEAHDDKLNAYITVLSKAAIAGAGRAEQELRDGRDRGPLHGIPIAFKDLIQLAGVRMTAASKVLEHNVADVTATAAARAQERGAVTLGTTNLQEFARGPTGVDSYFGAVSNPWDVTRIAGGSSSGSGAAVAGGMATVALGSDTGGSVRIPAALCGIVGIRPTYGLVSRYGAVPLGRSYDVLGPMARSVEDAALVLAAIAGRDPKDPATRDLPGQDYSASLRQGRDGGLKGARIGVPRNHFFPGIDAEVEALVRSAIAQLETLGADILEVDIPFAEYGPAVYTAVNAPDFGRYHMAALVSQRGNFRRLTSESFELGLFVPSLRHLQASAARQLFLRQTAEIFAAVDAIATPAVPVAAPAIGACAAPCEDIWRALLHNTVALSATGVPSLSVPCGFTKSGLPAGLQLVGRWWEEASLLRIAAAYEAASDWRARRPDFENATAPDRFPTAADHGPAEEAAAAPAIGEKSVLDWAQTIGLPVAESELGPLTVRVDKMLASLARLDELPLGAVEPNAYFRVPGPGEDPAV